MFDIGIISDCVSGVQRFAANLRADELHSFNITLLTVKWAMCQEVFPSQIQKFPLVVEETNATYSRARNVNLLKKMSRSRYFIAVDTDIFLRKQAFLNVKKYVRTGVAYFPIVWSRYSPKSISLVKRHLKRKKVRFATQHLGFWRSFGFGMFALHGSNVRDFALNEKFEGWGEEDRDFFLRVQKHMKIVRIKDYGFQHIWHKQRCENAMNEKTKTSCELSRIENWGSKLAFFLDGERSYGLNKNSLL